MFTNKIECIFWQIVGSCQQWKLDIKVDLVRIFFSKKIYYRNLKPTSKDVL